MRGKGSGGYTRRILRADLSTGKLTFEELSREMAYEYMGGRGFNAKILSDELDAKVDPLGPSNILIFATGPVTGTRIPCSGIHCTGGKSPLTGTICFSFAMEYFGAELKRAGLDAIVVKGASQKPAFLCIVDGEPEIREADHLWGLDTHRTEEVIRRDLGERKMRVACIGPAGERLVRYACIVNDKYAVAARGGLGAVAGSKKLKAVAVKGSKTPDVADAERVEEVRASMLKDLENPVMKELKHHAGTWFSEEFNRLGIIPVKNYQEGWFQGDSKLGKEAWRDWMVADRYNYECPIRCNSKFVKCDEEIVDLPEYETIWATGHLLYNDDLETVLKANMLLDTLGLDSISTGNCIAFAMECYQRGIISKQDAGLELTWGDKDSILSIIRMIAYREGFGGVLAEGVKRASETIGRGSEQYAMHGKGLELPGYDPRGSFGLALGFATASRGANQSEAYMPHYEGLLNVLGVMDRFDYSERKAQTTKDYQDFTAAFDSLVVCRYGFVRLWTARNCAEMLNSVTGLGFDEKEVMRVGERIFNLERLFNMREGFSRKDDTIPKRFLTKTLPSGPSSGRTVPLDHLLKGYYEARGWDEEGRPRQERLQALNLPLQLPRDRSDVHHS